MTFECRFRYIVMFKRYFIVTQQVHLDINQYKTLKPRFYTIIMYCYAFS